MPVGNTYPADIQHPDGTVIAGGSVAFTDSTNQPAPGGANVGTATAFAPTGLTGSVSATRYVGGTASVAPTTGLHAVGDWVVTATGRIFVCTVAGTPGTWVEPASVTFAPLASPTFTGTATLPATIIVGAIPTADPHVVGELWGNAGVLTRSAG